MFFGRSVYNGFINISKKGVKMPEDNDFRPEEPREDFEEREEQQNFEEERPVQEEQLEEEQPAIEQPFEEKAEEPIMEAPKEEPKKPKFEVPIAHYYKNTVLYVLRWIAMTILGWAFLGCMVSFLGLVIDSIMGGIVTNEGSYFNGVWVSLVTSVIVFGITHLLLFMTVGDDWARADGKEEDKTYQTVFTIIQCVISGIVAVTMLLIMVQHIVGALLFGNVTENEMIKQILICSSGIAILLFAAFEKTKLLVRYPKKLYPVVMGLVLVVGVVLFAMYPSKQIRLQIYDEGVSKDLSRIDSAIENYTYRQKEMPDGLEDLDIRKGDLNHDLSEYTYKNVRLNRGSNRCPENSGSGDCYIEYSYELCGTFKGESGNSSSDYWGGSFNYHDAGNYCFTRTEDWYN